MPSPFASASTQPRKNGVMGGAQRPVARQMPLGHVVPVVHVGGLPLKHTKSFWMPENSLEVPA